MTIDFSKEDAIRDARRQIQHDLENVHLGPVIYASISQGTRLAKLASGNHLRTVV